MNRYNNNIHEYRFMSAFFSHKRSVLDSCRKRPTIKLECKGSRLNSTDDFSI
jgi:hypothetical protein